LKFCIRSKKKKLKKRKKRKKWERNQTDSWAGQSTALDLVVQPKSLDLRRIKSTSYRSCFAYLSSVRSFPTISFQISWVRCLRTLCTFSLAFAFRVFFSYFHRVTLAITSSVLALGITCENTVRKTCIWYLRLVA
jgi:hypothetical protein